MVEGRYQGHGTSEVLLSAVKQCLGLSVNGALRRFRLGALYNALQALQFEIYNKDFSMEAITLILRKKNLSST